MNVNGYWEPGSSSLPVCTKWKDICVPNEQDAIYGCSYVRGILFKKRNFSFFAFFSPYHIWGKTIKLHTVERTSKLGIIYNAQKKISMYLTILDAQRFHLKWNENERRLFIFALKSTSTFLPSFANLKRIHWVARTWVFRLDWDICMVYQKEAECNGKCGKCAIVLQ